MVAVRHFWAKGCAFLTFSQAPEAVFSPLLERDHGKMGERRQRMKFLPKQANNAYTPCKIRKMEAENVKNQKKLKKIIKNKENCVDIGFFM